LLANIYGRFTRSSTPPTSKTPRRLEELALKLRSLG
jgi:hypothetical protein